MALSSTAIFVFAGNDTGYLNTRLANVFSSSNITPLPSWTLMHSLYSASSDPSNPKTANINKHLHLLQYSNLTDRTLLCTTSEHEPSTVVAIPQGPATIEFMRLLRDKLGVMWQPLRQGDVYVSNGSCWQVGMFAVQIGELLRDRGTANGGTENRGIIAAISVLAASDTMQPSLHEREILQEFCEDLGIIGPSSDLKPLVQAWGSARSWRAEAELWSDILRKLILSVNTRFRSVE